MSRVLIAGAVISLAVVVEVLLARRDREKNTATDRMRQLNAELAAGGERREWFV